MTSSVVPPNSESIVYPVLLEDCQDGEVVLALDEKRGIVLVSAGPVRPIGLVCGCSEGWHNCSEWKLLPRGTAIRFH